MLKRLFDLIAGGTALVLLSPLYLAIAAAVLLDSGWPVFFGQERVGRGFRMFTIWKFRSMRPDAAGPNVTAAGDPRITRIGRALRATKLDELPQFWNVFRGEMSLVGPRPEVPEYVDAYLDRYRRILEVRPGITDLASIRYRNEERILAGSKNPREYVDRILPRKLDLAEEYVYRQSLGLDVCILFHTFFAVLSKE